MAFDLILKIHADKKVICVQHHLDETLRLIETLKECISKGQICVVYDIQSYDSSIKNVLKRLWYKNADDPNEKLMEVTGDEVKFDDNFKLYLIASGEKCHLDVEFLTQNHFINFESTFSALGESFLQSIFVKERRKHHQDLDRVILRETNVFIDLRAKRKSMLTMLNKNDSSAILDKKDVADDLLQIKTEMIQLGEAKEALKKVKIECEEERTAFLKASEHAVMLYKTIQKLQFHNHLYKYSLKWFGKVLKTSIENSNKSRVIEKRIRYIKDHLTYSLFCQISNSLFKRDKMLFAFFLSCQLLIEEEKLDEKLLSLIPNLAQLAMIYYTDEKHENIFWLNKSIWDFFTHLESINDNMKGLCEDVLHGPQRWKVFYDAKEPDNLPLHEPWYSNLSKFQRLLVIAALRPDKLLELVHTFVSENVGFKFVEPLHYDLGRVFSDGEPKQPLVFLVDGENDASERIKMLAKNRSHKLRVTFTSSLSFSHFLHRIITQYSAPRLNGTRFNDYSG